VHQVTLARDGQEALQYLSKARKVPDMMLLDLKLPRIDGFELLKILKSEPRWADLPVVAISTSDIKRDMQTALALGAEEYIVKPTNFQELYDRIATIVNRLAEKVSK
jgi:two-component system response regulator